MSSSGPLTCSTCAVPARSAEARFCPLCGGAIGWAVQLTDLCKAFGSNRLLDRLCLSVPIGQSLVIVGLSGSGKSVLLEHIIGFQQPDSGSVLIAGDDLSRSPSEEEVRKLRHKRGLTLVFQGPALLDELDVLDNIALPLRLHGMPSTEARAKASKFLGPVGLAQAEAHLFPDQLSGGMQKRVGIARALVTEPAIVLYDEPTTGLDAATSRQISLLMRQVHAEPRGPGKARLTSITITHDYLSAAAVADRVVYLDRNTRRISEVLGVEAIREIRARWGKDQQAAEEEIRRRLEAFFATVQAGDSAAPRRRPETWFGAAAAVLLGALGLLGAGFRSLGEALLLLPRVGTPFSPHLVVRVRDIGLRSLLIVGASGAFLGMMLALQTARGFARAGAGGFDSLPAIVGLALVDKVGPLFAGLLTAGRIGASISAEMGGKRLSRQFDALRAMAGSAEDYWLRPIFWACVLSLPILTLALEACAFAGAYAVSAWQYQYVKGAYFRHHVLDFVSLREALIGLVRAAGFGGVIGLVAYANGAGEIRSSKDVGRATTATVVAASLGVILLDCLLGFLASFLGL